jgi:hypothetical protein
MRARLVGPVGKETNGNSREVPLAGTGLPFRVTTSFPLTKRDAVRCPFVVEFASNASGVTTINPAPSRDPATFSV